MTSLPIEMSSSGDSLPEVLARVDFPLYSVGVLSPRHLLVAPVEAERLRQESKNGFVSDLQTHEVDPSE